ncbi:uncharacterized protein LOC6567647 [Drosophila grimshawi]|uniref:GH21660 n=1 Tax=Drosophila grimshawi TaxID=7222 RepID=B4JRY3_DROGR|nr:uncharacterized protein LOC6567647 [Drosophila grimshawi]EDV94523.1 GH21660 [Drosophila grimshawi]
MPAAIALLLLITGQALLFQSGVQAKRYLGVGQRIQGDQLLLKDVQHSRPASISEPASVSFNYNINEPITYIEIVSEENISAEVKFSYTDSLVVGVVRMLANNESEIEATNTEDLSSAFDVIINIFGFNQTMLNVNPALLVNRDTQFEGVLKPYDDEYEEVFDDVYDNAKREQLLVDMDEDDDDDDDDSSESPTFPPDFEHKDKIIQIGERQEGDDLLYETFQTSSDEPKGQINRTVLFYYIDSDYITYIKFVIFDHFTNKLATADDYMAPVAEYSHYSPSTLKATITDFNTSSLFVQMFVYGYRGLDVPPPDYRPFLEPGSSSGVPRTAHLTPLQRMQLLLLTGQSTLSPLEDEEDSSEDTEEDGVMHTIRAEDMVPSIPNAGLDQQRPVQQRLYASMLGLMLFAVA